MKEGWEKKKLREVCEVINGLWKGKKEPFMNVGVIRNANFTKDCKLNKTNIEFIDVEVSKFLKGRKLGIFRIFLTNCLSVSYIICTFT